MSRVVKGTEKKVSEPKIPEGNLTVEMSKAEFLTLARLVGHDMSSSHGKALLAEGGRFSADLKVDLGEMYAEMRDIMEGL
jgi:hypothetical protein